MTPDQAMHRGDVWWVNFDPSLGGVIQKQRPAIVVSNDASNKYLNRVQVIPLTSNIDRVFPSEAVVLIEGERSKAMADQLTTVSKIRLINSMGRLSAADMQKIELAINIQLSLS